MTVKSRTIFFTVLITALAMTFYILDEWLQYSMNVELLHKEKVTVVDNYYNNFPRRTVQLLKANTKFILSDKEIKSAFIRRDKETLSKLANRYYSYTNSLFAKSGVLHNFILPDGTILHRSHKPSMSGQNIADRGMVKLALATKNSVNGIEKCRNGLFFQTCRTCYSRGEADRFSRIGCQCQFFC